MNERIEQTTPKTTRIWQWTAAAALAVAALALIPNHQQTATAQPASAAPGRTAIVDVVRLVNELESFKAGQREINELEQELNNRITEAQQRVEDAQSALEIAAEGSQDRLVEEAIDAGINLRAEVANRSLRIRLKSNEILRSTWNRVQDGIAEYAERNGYDVVMSDDSMLDPGIPLDADPEAYKSYMTDRRILHASDNADITDELITRMNNDYEAEMKRNADER
jgi:Skp family chaperone for outer membrane proteins